MFHVDFMSKKCVSLYFAGKKLHLNLKKTAFGGISKCPQS